MDVAAFERVHQAFEQFHAFFAVAFGRKQWREHSRHYLQGLLVQSQERRNAENLSEPVGVSARAMQRFLTDARWDDDAVTSRLQEYLGSRLAHPQAVWVLDGSDFPKQGVKSAGVARQYCGRLGKVANCQAGMFLAYVSPHKWAVGTTFEWEFDFPITTNPAYEAKPAPKRKTKTSANPKAVSSRARKTPKPATVQTASRKHPKLKLRWDVHSRGDENWLGCASEALSSVLGEWSGTTV